MARDPKPWWREDRKAFFVTIRGKRHNLGPDKANAKREYHRLLAEEREGEADPVASSSEGPTIAEVLDKYLEWALKNRARRTYEWYLMHFQDFISHLKEKAKLPASSLKPFMVTEWASSHESWGDNFRRGAIIGIQRPFNFAAKEGYIDYSTVRSLHKPPAKRREAYISPAEWVKIRDHYPKDDCFRVLLEFMWNTGCRPDEVSRIEVRHVDLRAKQVVFPKEEAKGKKRPRVILLNESAERIIRKLLKLHPAGLLFRNFDGNQWNHSSMNCRFLRLKKSLGVKHFAYAIRHGFCQRLLEQGVDHISVAELMGHQDAAMVAKVYSHMNRATGHLREALKKG